MTEDMRLDVVEASRAASPVQLPSQWDPDHVGATIVKAFVTLDRLPRLRGPREPGGNWPLHATEWADRLAQAELDESERRERDQFRNRTSIRPTGVEIKRMEIVFDWLRELRAEDSGMALVTSLWALRSARGRSVRALCAEKRWAPHTFYRKRAQALGHLAAWLNGRGVPVF